MLEFAGFIATFGLVVFITGALVSAADLSPAGRLVTAGILGLWAGLSAAGSAAGWMQITRPPVVGFFVVVPLLAAALFARGPLASLPLRLMIGLNIGRVFAVEFLLLAGQGQLSGPFPTPPPGATSSPAWSRSRCWRWRASPAATPSCCTPGTCSGSPI